jgi:DNA helicase-2/ATP-dependent DNA helicase PcrA
MRIVLNPYDSVSLRRVINVPARSIGATTISSIDQFAEANQLTFWDALKANSDIELTPRARRSVNGFVNLIERFQRSSSEKSLSEFIQEILDLSGYLEDVRSEKSEDAKSREENLGELVSVAQSFEGQAAQEILQSLREDNDPFADLNLTDEEPQPPTSGEILYAFLENVALVADLDTYEEGTEAVTLMTLHSAKGLEFPVVFLTGMEEGIFPHMRSLKSKAEMEEERRLCYVGITRAKKLLYLSFANCRSVFGNTQRNPLSRFVADIPQALFIPVDMRPKPGDPPLPPKPKPSLATPKWSDFDTERREKREQRIYSEPSIDLPYKTGDKVLHATFGKGTVVSIAFSKNDAKVSVAFPAPVGIKTLSATFANLEKA